MSERELVELCRRGDRQAQRAIYDRTAEAIYRLALRMTRNADDAFDVAQDTYVRAFTRIQQFDGRSSLATWLHRIAVNEALQLLRRRRNEQHHLRLIPAVEECETTPPSDDRKADLENAMADLPPTDRAILLLRYQQGLDYRQIAQALDCQPGTVASRLNRARTRLRALLADRRIPPQRMA